jgi:hypothetical protein
MIMLWSFKSGLELLRKSKRISSVVLMGSPPINYLIGVPDWSISSNA